MSGYDRCGVHKNHRVKSHLSAIASKLEDRGTFRLIFTRALRGDNTILHA